MLGCCIKYSIKFWQALVVLALTFFLAQIVVQADVTLKAEVEKEGQASDSQLNQGPTRLGRPTPQSNLQSALVDPRQFSRAFSGEVQQSSATGEVQPGNFSLPPKFDIGADRGQKELLIAWTRWHHQLSQAIYQRWSERAQEPGRATLKITITRDRHIIPKIMDSNGGSEFNADLMDSIISLDGNPGLTFPTGSQRQEVSFEADYIAGTNVDPGYSWIKNDYEQVWQNY